MNSFTDLKTVGCDGHHRHVRVPIDRVGFEIRIGVHKKEELCDACHSALAESTLFLHDEVRGVLPCVTYSP
jgi:hypothetical protein